MHEVDLHLHTTCSDGRLTPTKLVQLCAERRLRVIAICDHDSTAGVPEALEAARDFPEITVIPGIELSTDVPEAEVHVLGYFVDYLDHEFQTTLQTFRKGRQERGEQMVQRLNEMGVNISWERVKQFSQGEAIGRPHIAQAMVEAGYVDEPRMAFDRYLGRDGPAYVERVKLTPVETVSILSENGALPVMAHPTYSVSKSETDEMAAMKETLQELKAAGLVGMEVYYGDYAPELVVRLGELADELGLVRCGGSDFHGSGNRDEPRPGTVGPPMKTVDQLNSIKERRKADAS